MNVNARAGQGDDGMFVDASLLVDSAGRRSDVALKALAKQVKSDWTFDARVNGQQIVVDDLMQLAGAFSAKTQEKPAASSATTQKGGAKSAPVPALAKTPRTSTKPDTKAFWAGVQGQAGVDIKSVLYGEKWQVTGIAAVLKVDETRLALERAAARFDEKSSLSANAEVKFAAGKPQPYDLNAKFDLKDFDTVPVFKALDPNKPPTVEGVFNVDGNASGKGANLNDLTANTKGNLNLSSKGGLFRGLKFATTASKATQVAGALLGLAGVRGSQEIDLVGQLAGLLGEIPYDQLTLKVNRDDQLNIKLEDFNLISPNVHLQGKGSISSELNKPLVQQPLKMELSLGARGPVEDALNRGKQLSGTRDNLGYADFREPFVVGGTLENPDTSQLKTLLAKVAVGGVLDILGGKK